MCEIVPAAVVMDYGVNRDGIERFQERRINIRNTEVPVRYIITQTIN
jgi:hypothetical protein